VENRAAEQRSGGRQHRAKRRRVRPRDGYQQQQRVRSARIGNADRLDEGQYEYAQGPPRDQQLPKLLHPFTNSRSAASSITFTPRVFALSSFDPGSAPATT